MNLQVEFTGTRYKLFTLKKKTPLFLPLPYFMKRKQLNTAEWFQFCKATIMLVTCFSTLIETGTCKTDLPRTFKEIKEHLLQLRHPLRAAPDTTFKDLTSLSLHNLGSSETFQKKSSLCFLRNYSLYFKATRLAKLTSLLFSCCSLSFYYLSFN